MARKRTGSDTGNSGGLLSAIKAKCDCLITNKKTNGVTEKRVVKFFVSGSTTEPAEEKSVFTLKYFVSLEQQFPIDAF